MTSRAPGLHLNGLIKSFPSPAGTVHAVRGVDIEITPGETVALLGPNGAGKSTTIDMLLGLLAPDAGSVSLFGLNPADAISAGRVGAMLQIGGVVPYLSVRELLAMVASLYPNPLTVDEVVDLTGIADLVGRRTTKLGRHRGRAQVARGDDAMRAALEARPDLALLDIEMPGMDGLAAAAALRAELPACRMIMLTAFGRPGYLRRAMEAGAAGFVVKDAPAEQLCDAVRRVARGERRASGGSGSGGSDAGRRNVPLTGRERDALVAARDGATVADIAAKLFLSEGTVRNYLSAAIAKTGARNRAEALRFADERGWL